MAYSNLASHPLQREYTLASTPYSLHRHCEHARALEILTTDRSRGILGGHTEGTPVLAIHDLPPWAFHARQSVPPEAIAAQTHIVCIQGHIQDVIDYSPQVAWTIPRPPFAALTAAPQPPRLSLPPPSQGYRLGMVFLGPTQAPWHPASEGGMPTGQQPGVAAVRPLPPVPVLTAVQQMGTGVYGPGAPSVASAYQGFQGFRLPIAGPSNVAAGPSTAGGTSLTVQPAHAGRGSKEGDEEAGTKEGQVSVRTPSSLMDPADHPLPGQNRARKPEETRKDKGKARPPQEREHGQERQRFGTPRLLLGPADPPDDPRQARRSQDLRRTGTPAASGSGSDSAQGRVQGPSHGESTPPAPVRERAHPYPYPSQDTARAQRGELRRK
ncbi:hypothetical protein BC628DRAFT_1419747 [Trametes gibbosa]|nr:hypothetical protein BC628DRAFT_1419747 [Trametes gibbosa]